MRQHLASYVDEGPSALVFTGPKGGPIWRGNFRKLTAWTKTIAELGFAGLHFHDLRHNGNTLAARSGVSTRDLMARMGHDSVRAAIIYQHATTEVDARIAAALEAELSGDDEDQADDDAGRMMTTTARRVRSSPPGDGEHCGPCVARRPIGPPVEPERAPLHGL